MAIARNNYFAHEDLSHYSTRQRLTIRFTSFVFYWGIRLSGWTVRFDAEGMETFDRISARNEKAIMAFWHDRIFLSTYYFRNRGIIGITSKSFDGEYLARIIQQFGYGAIRGSSSRGGSKALIEMIRAMREGASMAVTLDGPRGPRHVAKAGAIVLAKKTGNPLVPCTVEAENYWTLKSWDRMQIPRPFTRARVIVGAPIYVPYDASEELMEAKLAELEESQSKLSSGNSESTFAANIT